MRIKDDAQEQLQMDDNSYNDDNINQKCGETEKPLDAGATTHSGGCNINVELTNYNTPSTNHLEKSIDANPKNISDGEYGIKKKIYY